MADLVNYSYSDLDHILNEARDSSANLGQELYSFNTGRKTMTKEPKERAETIPRTAQRGNLKALYTVEKTVNNANKIINENQKLIQQYREETDRRNAILNRMGWLRGVMKARADSDKKNREAGAKMVSDAVREYFQLNEEALKFTPYIKK